MAHRINLIPPSERLRTKTDFALLGLVGAGIIIIFAVAFGYYLLNGSLSDRRAELADLQQQNANLQAQLASLQPYEVIQSQRNAAQKNAQGIYAARTNVTDILDAISLVIPENAWFQSLKLTAADPLPPDAKPDKPGSGSAVEAGTLEIEGDTYSFEDVAQVITRMQLVPSLSAVTLGSAGDPRSDTDPNVEVRGYSISATITAPTDNGRALPLSQVQVDRP